MLIFPVINFKPHGDIPYRHPSTVNTHTQTSHIKNVETYPNRLWAKSNHLKPLL